MTCHYNPHHTNSYDYNNYYHNKPCNIKVGENEYYCPIHKFNNACNYHHNHTQCKEYHFYEHSCLQHYYIQLEYIVLSNKKITLTHPMSLDVIDINTYLVYYKHNLNCKYTINPNFGAMKYYITMLPRWITMYLVVKEYLHNKAYDVFSNIANYYKTI